MYLIVTSKCFMLTTDSLKVLVDIANSKKFNGFLHHVHLMTALFSTHQCRSNCACPPKMTVRWEEALKTYIADQESLIKFGAGKTMLTESLSKLTALKGVSIDDTLPYLDVDYRGNNKARRLCGRAPSLLREVSNDKKYNDFVRHLWKILLDSVAAAKPSTLIQFEMNTTGGGYLLEVEPDLALATRKEVQSAFAKVEHLKLNVCTDPKRKYSGTKDELEKRKKALSTMKKLAKSLPRLQRLVFALDGHSKTGSFFAAFTTHLDLTIITNLHLESMSLASATMRTALTKCTSIKDLRLLHINLTKGTWVPILKAVQGLTATLKHLHLMFLMERELKVYFLKQAVREGDDEDESEFSDDEDPSGDDDTDDDMPPLEPLTPYAASPGNLETSATGTSAVAGNTILPSPSPHGSGSAPTSNSGNASAIGQNLQPTVLSDTDAINDYIAPNDPGGGERGYYVCVRDKIAAQLPTFIAEYNLGESIEDEYADMVGGAFAGPFPGLPPGVGPVAAPAIISSFAAAMGVYGPPPPPGGLFAQPNGQTGAGAGTANTTATGTANAAAISLGLIPPPPGASAPITHGSMPPLDAAANSALFAPYTPVPAMNDTWASDGWAENDDEWDDEDDQGGAVI